MKSNRLWYAIIGGLALVSVVSLLLIQGGKQEGDWVELYQDGVLIETLPLNKDATIHILAKNGGENVVTIQDGSVQMTEATCPDQVCVRHGPTRETGDPIVCLPNRLVVKVVKRDASSLDGVTQ